MIIVSQHKDKTTQSLEFSIRERESCKSIFIDKETWQKFKKITQRTGNDNQISLKELKGIGELLEKSTTRYLYEIVEVKRNRVFGTYTSKAKAKQVLQKMLQKVEKQNTYQMPEDKDLEITIF